MGTLVRRWAGRAGRWVSLSSSSWQHTQHLVGAGRWKFRECTVAKCGWGFVALYSALRVFDSINKNLLNQKIEQRCHVAACGPRGFALPPPWAASSGLLLTPCMPLDP